MLPFEYQRETFKTIITEVELAKIETSRFIEQRTEIYARKHTTLNTVINEIEYAKSEI
jgi:hypothetical protein